MISVTKYTHYTENINEKKFLINIFFISLFIKLLYGIIFYYIKGTTSYSDDFVYMSFAKHILEQGIFVTDIKSLSPIETGITPFYPYLVAFSFKIFGEQIIPLIILNCLFASFSVIGIYYLGKLSFNKTVAVSSSLWALIYVSYYKWLPNVLKESFLQILVLGLVISWIILMKQKINYKYLIISVVIFVISVHTDERYFVYSILYPLVIFTNEKANLKQKIKYLSVTIIFVIIFMSPWFIRNFIVYKRPVILSERVAIITDKIFGYQSNPMMQQEYEISNETLDSLRKGISIYDSSFEGMYKLSLEYGLQPEKFSPIRKMYVEFKELWRPFRLSNMMVSNGLRPEGKWSLNHNLSIFITYGILLPFMLTGIFYAFKRKNKAGKLFFIIFLLHTLIHITFVLSQFRYRVPIDSLIIVLSFYGLICLLNSKKSVINA